MVASACFTTVAAIQADVFMADDLKGIIIPRATNCKSVCCCARNPRSIKAVTAVTKPPTLRS